MTGDVSLVRQTLTAYRRELGMVGGPKVTRRTEAADRIRNNYARSIARMVLRNVTPPDDLLERFQIAERIVQSVLVRDMRVARRPFPAASVVSPLRSVKP